MLRGVVPVWTTLALSKQTLKALCADGVMMDAAIIVAKDVT